MQNKKVQSIRLAPFSNKYVEYFEKSKTARINCLEGAIRSGKTILNICAFTNYLDNHKSGGNFVASGISAGVAWEVLAECRGHNSEDGQYGAVSGFGLMYMFQGRCRKGKVKNSDALIIRNRLGKECRIMFVGAKSKGSIEAIRGLTISGWIATELENHSTEEGNDFIGFMFGRMLGSPDGKMFFDLNPSFPTNKMYTKYLDHFMLPVEEGGIGDEFNYLKCGIFDNAGFSQKQVEDTLKLYIDKTSTMYRRDILGDRACSEGLIFGMFAKDKSKWVINDLDEFKKGIKPQFISIGIDFGGNGSNTTFVASVLYNNFHGVFPVASDILDMSGGDKDVKDFREKLRQFILFVQVLDIVRIGYIWGDSEETVMINEIKSLLKEMKLYNQIRVLGSKKHTIKKRIQTKEAMMSVGHWHVYKDCESVIKSTETQVWDSREGHEDERLDNGSVDIDTADASGGR